MEKITRSKYIFEGLDDIPWTELPTAYGSGEEVPIWLRQLVSNEKQVRQMAIRRLGHSLEHQGGINPATAYAVPYLIALLQEPTIQEKYEILGWLSVFFKAYHLDEKMWYGEEGAESYGAWGVMPRHIPYKDSHAIIEDAVPTYITLLDTPVLIDRLEAVHLLTYFTKRAQELWPMLQAAVEREQTEPGQADLILALGRLARSLPEKRAFFLERFQTEQSELCAFATALVLARLYKEETPEEAAQLLIRVMLQAPPSLDLYLRLPCGGRYPWNDALWALANLGPARLKSLLPMLVEHFHQINNRYDLEIEFFARLLLFIAFEEKPEQGHPPRPAAMLTEQQQQILLELLEQGKLWHYLNFSYLLKAYGLPGMRQELATYLGQMQRAEAFALELEEKARKFNARNKAGPTPSDFAEMDHFFAESPKLGKGEEETPIGGYFY